MPGHFVINVPSVGRLFSMIHHREDFVSWSLRRIISSFIGMDKFIQTLFSPHVTLEFQGKIIANLAAVVFHALDFGLADDEERHLSSELESLLDAMASADNTNESSCFCVCSYK
ncbi:unnamed protein product [Allacma fusca]|uniref:KIND domain-containing protein n=1 Tax=Allacma fusca TaxID=39272 RepID=A0A8J2LPL8_9HEXA|nr:unnamed protein product [Allacma fusca]